MLAMVTCTSKLLAASLSRFLDEALEIPFIYHLSQHPMGYKRMYRFFENVLLLLSLSPNIMTIWSWLITKSIESRKRAHQNRELTSESALNAFMIKKCDQ